MSRSKDRKVNARHVDVAIIGAGAAGLTAGYLLTKAGHSVAIVEADPHHVGGIARTVMHDECRFDIGDHGIAAVSQRIADLWDEILPDGLLARTSKTRVHTGPAVYRQALRDYRLAREFRLAQSTQRMVERVEIWADALRGQGPQPSPVEEPTTEVLVEHVNYPRLGVGSLCEAARDRIRDSAGGEMLMGHKLGRLAADGQGGWRLTATGAEGETTFAARHAISTLPLRELAPRLHPLPRSVLESEQLRLANLVTVALILRGAQPFAEASVRLRESGLRVGEIRNVRARSPEMLPGSHLHCVCLDYVSGSDDDLAAMSDDQITFLAMAELQALGLCDLRNVDGSTVVRTGNAIPVQSADSAARVQALVGELADLHPTLHLAGSLALHTMGGIEQDMIAAIRAVEGILGSETLEATLAARDLGEITEVAAPIASAGPAGETHVEPDATVALQAPVANVKRAA